MQDSKTLKNVESRRNHLSLIRKVTHDMLTCVWRFLKYERPTAVKSMCSQFQSQMFIPGTFSWDWGHLMVHSKARRTIPKHCEEDSVSAWAHVFQLSPLLKSALWINDAFRLRFPVFLGVTQLSLWASRSGALKASDWRIKVAAACTENRKKTRVNQSRAGVGGEEEAAAADVLSNSAACIDLAVWKSAVSLN